MISEKNEYGKRRCKIRGTLLIFSWRYWQKKRDSVRRIDRFAETWTWTVPNTKQGCFLLNGDLWWLRATSSQIQGLH